VGFNNTPFACSRVHVFFAVQHKSCRTTEGVFAWCLQMQREPLSRTLHLTKRLKALDEASGVFKCSPSLAELQAQLHECFDKIASRLQTFVRVDCWLDGKMARLVVHPDHALLVRCKVSRRSCWEPDERERERERARARARARKVMVGSHVRCIVSSGTPTIMQSLVATRFNRLLRKAGC